MTKTKQIPLPPEVPTGFCWQLNADYTWTLSKTEPALLFKIMIDGRYHCGYYDPESVEIFLPEYQRQYPNSTVVVQTETTERPVHSDEE